MSKNQLIDISSENIQQTAILVAVQCQKDSEYEVRRSLEELGRLAETAEIAVHDKCFQKREKVDSNTYVGTGFLAELKEKMQSQHIDLLIFDDELTPSQIAHIERKYDIAVLDRTELILNIFYMHARTSEARLEIRLAELYYEKPRLRNNSSGLDRIVGGSGGAVGLASRGSGETKLEMDRRTIDKEIMRIKRELADIDRQKETQAKLRSSVKRVCLVGYTNAGKSALFHTLTGADVYVRDELFATLSAVSRQLSLFAGCDVVLSDTVGFISKLPHQLIASFTATLKEVKDADLLLHVIDLADKDCETYISEVNKVLVSLGVNDTPILSVFNKIDICDFETDFVVGKYPAESVVVSATSQINIDKLLDSVKNALFVTKEYRLLVPPSQQRILADLHDKVEIVDKSYDENGNLVLRIVANVEYEREFSGFRF